jgi:hypothetical protein
MQPKTQFYVVNLVGLIAAIGALFGFNMDDSQRAALGEVLTMGGVAINAGLVWYHSRASNELTSTVTGNQVGVTNPPAAAAVAPKQGGFADLRFMRAVLLLALGLVLLLGVALRSHADATCPMYTVCLTWTPPSTRVDNSALPASQLGNYVLYRNGHAVAYPGAGTTAYAFPIAIGDTILPSDVWTMTASDSKGLISAMSNNANVIAAKAGPPASSVVIPLAKPAPITNLKAV